MTVRFNSVHSYRNPSGKLCLTTNIYNTFTALHSLQLTTTISSLPSLLCLQFLIAWWQPPVMGTRWLPLYNPDGDWLEDTTLGSSCIAVCVLLRNIVLTSHCISMGCLCDVSVAPKCRLLGVMLQYGTLFNL
jgi:hypothetical protein